MFLPFFDGAQKRLQQLFGPATQIIACPKSLVALALCGCCGKRLFWFLTKMLRQRNIVTAKYTIAALSSYLRTDSCTRTYADFTSSLGCATWFSCHDMRILQFSMVTEGIYYSTVTHTRPFVCPKTSRGGLRFGAAKTNRGEQAITRGWSRIFKVGYGGGRRTKHSSRFRRGETNEAW